MEKFHSPFARPPSTINVHVGQCGNQMARALWTEFLEDVAGFYALQTLASNQRKPRSPAEARRAESRRRCLEFLSNWVGQWFSVQPVPSSAMPTSLVGAARAVLLDTEPKVINSLLKAFLRDGIPRKAASEQLRPVTCEVLSCGGCVRPGSVFRVGNAVCQQSGRGNNWSVGYFQGGVSPDRSTDGNTTGSRDSPRVHKVEGDELVLPKRSDYQRWRRPRRSQRSMHPFCRHLLKPVEAEDSDTSTLNKPRWVSPGGSSPMYSPLKGSKRFMHTRHCTFRYVESATPRKPIALPPPLLSCGHGPPAPGVCSVLGFLNWCGVCTLGVDQLTGPQLSVARRLHALVRQSLPAAAHTRTHSVHGSALTRDSTTFFQRIRGLLVDEIRRSTVLQRAVLPGWQENIARRWFVYCDMVADDRNVDVFRNSGRMQGEGKHMRGGDSGSFRHSDGALRENVRGILGDSADSDMLGSPDVSDNHASTITSDHGASGSSQQHQPGSSPTSTDKHAPAPSTSLAVWHSLAGGTGGGLSSRIYELVDNLVSTSERRSGSKGGVWREHRISSLSSTQPRSTTCGVGNVVGVVVFPFASGENPLQHYNIIASLAHAHEFSDAVLYACNDDLLSAVTSRRTQRDRKRRGASKSAKSSFSSGGGGVGGGGGRGVSNGAVGSSFADMNAVLASSISSCLYTEAFGNFTDCTQSVLSWGAWAEAKEARGMLQAANGNGDSCDAYDNDVYSDDGRAGGVRRVSGDTGQGDSDNEHSDNELALPLWEAHLSNRVNVRLLQQRARNVISRQPQSPNSRVFTSHSRVPCRVSLHQPAGVREACPMLSSRSAWECIVRRAVLNPRHKMLEMWSVDRDEQQGETQLAHLSNPWNDLSRTLIRELPKASFAQVSGSVGVGAGTNQERGRSFDKSGNDELHFAASSTSNPFFSGPSQENTVYNSRPHTSRETSGRVNNRSFGRNSGGSGGGGSGGMGYAKCLTASIYATQHSPLTDHWSGFSGSHRDRNGFLPPVASHGTGASHWGFLDGLRKFATANPVVTGTSYHLSHATRIRPTGGSGRTLSVCLNRTRVVDVLQNNIDCARRKLETNAFVHHFERWGVERQELVEWMGLCVDIAQDYRELQFGSSIE